MKMSSTRNLMYPIAGSLFIIGGMDISVPKGTIMPFVITGMAIASFFFSVAEIAEYFRDEHVEGKVHNVSIVDINKRTFSDAWKDYFFVNSSIMLLRYIGVFSMLGLPIDLSFHHFSLAILGKINDISALFVFAMVFILFGAREDAEMNKRTERDINELLKERDELLQRLEKFNKG